MIQLYCIFMYSLIDDFNDKHWLRLFFKVLGGLILVICTAFLLAQLILFVLRHIEQIVVTIGSIFCFFMVLYSFFPKKKQEPIPDTSIMEYDPITLETTYKLIRKNICSIIGDIAEMTRLRQPASLSQLDCPTHYDIVAQAVIYHFLVIKQSSEIDSFSIIGILQNAIEQRLNNNEVEGITQTAFFYNGQVYPSIMVDNVQDLGNYAQIDIAIASEYYCKYRERRIYNNMNQNSISRHMDRDF